VRRPVSTSDARAFLGRPTPESASHFLGAPKTCSQCPAGGDSTSRTAPESRVLRAASGAGGARLCRAGAGAGEERA